jgi:uncharacterized protein (TIGR03382 family)
VRLNGVPLHDGAATPRVGVAARLSTSVSAPAAGSILVLDDASQLVQVLDTHASTLGGVILVNGDAEGEIVLRNVTKLEKPYSLPVLQVARREASMLLARSGESRTARLIVDFERRPARATNVVALLKARDADGLVVVMTPKSGWFTCASERGGGIAIAMALASSLAALTVRRKNVLFLFTSGHELSQCGLASYLRDNPSVREGAETWVHLGASIGARRQTYRRLFSRDNGLREALAAALARQNLDPIEWAPPEQRPFGESGQVFDKRFVSIIGTHAYFHSPNDLPELTVEGDAVSRFARAFWELVRDLVV